MRLLAGTIVSTCLNNWNVLTCSWFHSMTRDNGIAITHFLPRLCNTRPGAASEKTTCARYMTKRVIGMKNMDCWLKQSKLHSLPGTLRVLPCSLNALSGLTTPLTSCTHCCVG